MCEIENFFGDVPIYWINLKDSLDRQQNAIRQLNGYKNHLRIEAIDGRNGEYYSKQYKINYNSQSEDWSTATTAATCSHMKAIKKAYDTN